MVKLLSESEINTLAGCYMAGTSKTGGKVDSNQMLDMINMVRMIRNINAILNMIIDGNLPVIYHNGKLSIVLDEHETLEVSKVTL